MSADLALQRTVDLVRSDIFPTVSPAEIVDALTSVRMCLRISERDASCSAGQTALVTSAIVAAQCGVQLVLDVVDAPLLPNQPPLHGESLIDSLLRHTSELITPATAGDGVEVDTTITFGSTDTRDKNAMRLSPNGGGFLLAPRHEAAPTAWTEGGIFAALFGGVAVGAEAFRTAMRTLARRGHTAKLANAVRGPRPVHYGVADPRCAPELGPLDVISAGAITNGMLFALLRVPGLSAAVRVFDQDVFDWPNLNRYPLGSQALVGEPKAPLLERYSTPRLIIESVSARFDDRLATSLKLVPLVAVGVDDIPSRWCVQRAAPGAVVVGGTSHFEVIVSEHPIAEPCAGCLYRDGEDDGRPIPTVSFVSTFAGFLQAYRLLTMQGCTHARQTRAAPLNLAGSQPIIELGVPRRLDCPARCRA
jgi:hypothetical protein